MFTDDLEFYQDTDGDRTDHTLIPINGFLPPDVF